MMRIQVEQHPGILHKEEMMTVRTCNRKSSGSEDGMERGLNKTCESLTWT